MISSSALSNFGWTVSTLSSPAAGALLSEADAGAAGSFQNILTNTAAQPHFASMSPAPLDFSGASNWTTQAATATSLKTTFDDTPADVPASPDCFGAGPASEQASEPVSGSSGENSGAPAAGPAMEPIRERDGNPTPNSTLSFNPLPAVVSGSVKTSNPEVGKNPQVGSKQVTTKVDKKLDQFSHPLHTAVDGGRGSGAPASVAAVAGRSEPQRASGANRAAAQAITPDRSTEAEQAIGVADLSSKPGSLMVTSVSASNGLSGAAFALHISPIGSRSDATQKSPSAAPASGQVPTASAAAANPSDHTVSDPSALGGGVNDPASLLASGPMMSNIGATRSRQVSALGPTSALAETGPWSAAASSPSLLNDPAHATESIAAPAPVAEVEEDPAGAAQPVRTLQLQLGGSGDQRVDLRLVEHAGGLSVSVRSSDSNLTRGLQDNLPELSSRLAAEHYQTEVWLPAAGQTSAAAHSSSSAEQPPPDRRGGQSSQGGSSSSGGQGNPQQGRQNQPPAWWRQLAALERASTSTSVPSPNYFKEK